MSGSVRSAPLAVTKLIRAGNAESADHGIRCNSISEIDDVIDHRGVAGIVAIGSAGIGCGQSDLSNGLQMNSVVRTIEPDQGLSFGAQVVFARVNVRHFIGHVPGGLLQRFLNTIAGKDVVAVAFQRHRRTNDCDRKEPDQSDRWNKKSQQLPPHPLKTAIPAAGEAEYPRFVCRSR